MRKLHVGAWCAIALALCSAISCRRQPAVSDETYRQAITAFHVSLAAMQTSQDLLARGELERLTGLVPQEPAGWANLGLLLLRQQQVEEAVQHLERAATLAPKSAPIARLLALAESQQGDLEGSISQWRRAMSLDSADVKAPFALAQEVERRAGAEDDAEAQRILEALLARSGNLAARLEHARLAAKRGDREALNASLDALGSSAASWPPEARDHLQTVREAAARNPAEAATPVIFLRNVLLQTPEYRTAHAAVSTPRSEVGEPLVELVTLPNPPPHAAAPDEGLAWSVDAAPAAGSGGATWAGVVWLTGAGAPSVIVAGAREVRTAAGAVFPFPSGADGSAPGPHGVLAADLNYDFRTDLVLAGAGGMRILRQGDKEAFTDVTASTRLPAEIIRAPLHGVWTADLDTDGDLDLIVARVDGPPAVLRNNGDGTFAVQAPFEGVTRLRGFAWADLDGEGVPDAVLLDEAGRLHVFLSLRGGPFAQHPLPANLPALAAVTVADVNGNGILDVVGVSPQGAILRVSPGAGGATDVAQIARVEPPQGLAPGTSRLLTADLDNNGAADLIVAGNSESRVLLGAGPSEFRALPGTVALAVSDAADIDGNGRIDLVGRAGDGVHVARSTGQKPYHWQAIRPIAANATGDQRINSFGIGGEVEIRTGLHAQKKVIASPVVHFGLGEASRAEVARITWPNGVLQSEFDLQADTVIAAGQRLKGSCPWLFAWNGREMAFVTDFLWRSPLGLRINAQDTADVLMTEEWVKLRGDQLAPRDGAYDLRVAAELWETHFFDMVSLLVVDHPEGTEVFIDERFAVPAPGLDVIVTSPVQAFAAALDDGGRNVSEVVRARDDRHLDFAGRGDYQGVTRKHYVELELPEEAPRTGPLWLVAQGWVHPTDSSINVALAQGAHSPPEGLSLHVADRAGRFRPVRTGLGFPAGKDKTILLDLDGVFPRQGPRRLRLQTNMEVFWDRLGWAAGRPDVRVEPQRIELQSAELRYRGYSVTHQKDASTPERPQYVIEGTSPRWRDLEGFHTRFGDVRELLLNVDDRYVIMNAGDEMLLRFPEAAPVRSGFVRDFVVVGDGWEKDGDYNTTASRTVLPLPTHRSASYVPGTGRLKDDPVYRQHMSDFQHYHTRYVSPEAFRDALRVRMDRHRP